MFKNILVPTDGSALSQSAAKTAVALAKATGARITAFHVVPNSEFDVGPACLNTERIGKIARATLDHVRSLASCAGVPCDSHYVTSHSAAHEIVKAAGTYDCDGIVMGSHGRRGLTRLLLGSETQKVLLSAMVPVMVIRMASADRLTDRRQRQRRRPTFLKEQTMDIARLCTRDVIAVPQSTTLQAAAALMRERHVGCLLITRSPHSTIARSASLPTAT